jgi:hypothetical protein
MVLGWYSHQTCSLIAIFHGREVIHILIPRWYSKTSPIVENERLSKKLLAISIQAVATSPILLAFFGIFHTLGLTQKEDRKIPCVVAQVQLP